MCSSKIQVQCLFSRSNKKYMSISNRRSCDHPPSQTSANSGSCSCTSAQVAEPKSSRGIEAELLFLLLPWCLAGCAESFFPQTSQSNELRPPNCDSERNVCVFTLIIQQISISHHTPLSTPRHLPEPSLLLSICHDSLQAKGDNNSASS